jgi:hypothetical protein
MRFRKRQKSSSIPTYNPNLKSRDNRALSLPVRRESPPTNEAANENPQPDSPPPRRKGGGPKTQEGKKRARGNAAKHRILSRVVLVEGESDAELNALRASLRKDCDPKGAVEELLVDDLATLFWRLRRPIIAEGAQIRMRRAFLEADLKRRQDDQAASLILFSGAKHGLIREIANPIVHGACRMALSDLGERIANRGFDEKNDTYILRKIYGFYITAPVVATLLDRYLECAATASSAATTGENSDPGVAEEAKQRFLIILDEELERIETQGTQRELTDYKKLEIEAECGIVPDGHELDNVLKHETTIRRAIERTLNLLERAQRKRRGEPGAPTLNLNL